MRSLVFAAIWFGVALGITAFVADTLQKWRVSQVRTQQAIIAGPQDLPYDPPGAGRGQHVSDLR
jgi:hypothetical protein